MNVIQKMLNSPKYQNLKKIEEFKKVVLDIFNTHRGVKIDRALFKSDILKAFDEHMRETMTITYNPWLGFGESITLENRIPDNGMRIHTTVPTTSIIQPGSPQNFIPTSNATLLTSEPYERITFRSEQYATFSPGDNSDQIVTARYNATDSQLDRIATRPNDISDRITSL